MYRSLLAAAVTATALAAASSASAVVWTSNLEYQGVNGPAAKPYGVVTIEDGINFGKTVKVSVALTNPKSLFLNTGGPHDPFLYNVLSAPGVQVVNAINQNFFDGGYSNPGVFEATPFGLFTSKIGIGDWVDGQNVVSGFHFVDQTTSQQVLVGYQIGGYEIKGYEISGYEPKRDKNGKIVLDKNGKAVDDKSKPIYDQSKPIYNYNKPIYDQTKPIYETKTTTTKVKVLDYTYVPGHWVEAGNGASNGVTGPLEFYLHDDAGLTFAGVGFNADPDTGRLLAPFGTGNRFFSNTGGWWFTADIFDADTGKTYNVAAKDAFCDECIVKTAVPEPGAWALMILGFGMAGALVRRQRRFAAA